LKSKTLKALAIKIIDFSPQFNVLIGDNGTGKTAVLDALAVGIGTLLLGFDDIVSRTIKSHEIRHIDRELGQITTFEPQYPVIVQRKMFFANKYPQKTFSSEVVVAK